MYVGLCASRYMRAPMHPRASVLAHGSPTYLLGSSSFALSLFRFLLLHPFAHLLLLILGATLSYWQFPHRILLSHACLRCYGLGPSQYTTGSRRQGQRLSHLHLSLAGHSTTSRHRHRPPHHQHITSASPIHHRFITSSSSAHHRHLGHLSAGRLTLLRNRRPRVRLPRTRCLHTTTWKPFTRFSVPAAAFSPSAGPAYLPHLDCPPFAALGATGGITMPPSSPPCAPS